MRHIKTQIAIVVLAIAVTLTGTAHATQATPSVTKQTWQWQYKVWMPQHWQNLAQCEEHLDWHHSGGDYEGAFAFARTTWDAFKYNGYPSSAANATPWQQYRVARRIAAHYHSIAGSWGCWRGPQHAWVRNGLPEHGTWK